MVSLQEDGRSTVVEAQGAAAAGQQMAPLRRPVDPAWHRDASTLFPLAAFALLPLPPSLLLPHSPSLSAYSIHLSIFHKHQQSLHQSPRYERYYGAKNGISAPRKPGLLSCAPLRLSVDRLGLDGTAGTRAL